MAGPPKAEILKRVRELLDEEVEGYWLDERLLALYDEGARKQHRVVFDNAEKAGLLRQGSHDYLRAFYATPVTGTLTQGTQDYAIPADLYRLRSVVFGDAPPRLALLADWQDDHLIRTSPQFGPTLDQPVVTIRPDNNFMFYVVPGNRTVPTVAEGYTVYYWRDVSATKTNVAVDLPDPWNEGPIFYAAAVALGKERSEMTPYMTLFDAHSASIIPPPPAPARPA